MNSFSGTGLVESSAKRERDIYLSFFRDDQRRIEGEETVSRCSTTTTTTLVPSDHSATLTPSRSSCSTTLISFNVLLLPHPPTPRWQHSLRQRTCTTRSIQLRRRTAIPSTTFLAMVGDECADQIDSRTNAFLRVRRKQTRTVESECVCETGGYGSVEAILLAGQRDDHHKVSASAVESLHSYRSLFSRNGRRLFPNFRVSVSELDPTTKYMILLDIVPMDDNRYKYQESAWIISGKAEPHSYGRYGCPPLRSTQC